MLVIQGYGAVALEPHDHPPISLTGQCPAGFRQAHGAEGESGIAQPLALPTMGGPGCQTLMPGVRGPDRYSFFAIWALARDGDRMNKQSVIS